MGSGMRLSVLALGLLSGCVTGSGRPAGRQKVTALRPESPSPILLANACTPGMSCFGHIQVLPSGEVIEAAAATTAAAAMMAGTNDTPTQVEASKAKPEPKTKSTADTKAETKAEPIAKKEKPCIPKGGVAGPGQFKEYRGKDVWIECEYLCGSRIERRKFSPGIEADCWNFIPTYTN